jgi:hypothetical protein
MTSAWGYSWGSSWGNSWGYSAIQPPQIVQYIWIVDGKPKTKKERKVKKQVEELEVLVKEISLSSNFEKKRQEVEYKLNKIQQELQNLDSEIVAVKKWGQVVELIGRWIKRAEKKHQELQEYEEYEELCFFMGML